MEICLWTILRKITAKIYKNKSLQILKAFILKIGSQS